MNILLSPIIIEFTCISLAIVISEIYRVLVCGGATLFISSLKCSMVRSDIHSLAEPRSSREVATSAVFTTLNEDILRSPRIVDYV